MGFKIKLPVWINIGTHTVLQHHRNGVGIAVRKVFVRRTNKKRFSCKIGGVRRECRRLRPNSRLKAEFEVLH